MHFLNLKETELLEKLVDFGLKLLSQPQPNLNSTQKLGLAWKGLQTTTHPPHKLNVINITKGGFKKKKKLWNFPLRVRTQPASPLNGKKYKIKHGIKKVYPFAANLVNMKYKNLAHLNHTNG